MNIEEQTRTTRENSLGWMIQRLARILDDDMSERLAVLGLTIQQFAVLMQVLEQGGLSQASIGNRFGMPAYAISRALDGLGEQGLIERRIDPNSRRSHLIFPTQAALDLAPQMFETVKKVNAKLVAPLDRAESAAFSKLLARILSG